MHKIERLYIRQIVKNFANRGQRYIFIRFYKTRYLNKANPINTIQLVGNKFIDKSKDGNVYTHVNMNYTLNDNFIGLDFKGAKQPNAVYKETIAVEDGRISGDSYFSVYALPVQEIEYNLIRKELDKLQKSSKIKYDRRTLGLVSWLMLKRRGNLNKLISFSFLDNKAKKLFCSSFVMYVLYNTVSTIKQWMDKNKLSVYDFSPNTVTLIPGLKMLFNGKFKYYEQERNKFLSSHSEYDMQ